MIRNTGCNENSDPHNILMTLIFRIWISTLIETDISLFVRVRIGDEIKIFINEIINPLFS